MRRLAAAMIVAGLLAPVQFASAQSANGRILVMPFENVTHESRIVWLGEAASVLLADDLNALGTRAITREERRKAFEELQVLQAATLTDATVFRIGQIVGASQVVVGTLRLEGDDLIVQARAIALESARVQSRATERGKVAELFAIFERVARRLTPPPARDSGIIPPPPPVGAFENYIKGLLAETPGTAINYLRAALQADPRFDRARLALWDVYAEQSEHAQALEAVTAVPATSPLARRARFLAGLSQINLSRSADAFATFKALADQQATAPVLNNLGVIQLRRGGAPTTGTAVYYFTKAAEADPTDADYCFNLGYAYFFDRDMQAAMYWLREAVRRDPTNGDAHVVLAAVLTASGNLTEATRERELARRLSANVDAKKPATVDAVPKGLERLKDEIDLPHGLRVEESLASGGQRDSQQLAAFYLDRGRRLFQREQDREALTELSRVVFLSPYQAEAHLLIGRIHLRGGQVQEAIEAFKIAIWSADNAAGHTALAEAYFEARDVEASRAEATRALELDPSASDARQLLNRLPAP